MTKELPPRPHPDPLRRQARLLLRGWRSGDGAALARAAPFHFAGTPRLAQAQLVIAREHGFASWAELMHEVQRRSAAELSEADWLAHVAALAIGSGFAAPQPQRALALARSRRPGPAPAAIALMTGDLPAAQALLAGLDLRAPLPPWNAPPIVYAAASALARLDECRPGLVACVRWLLAQGADPNARWADPVWPDQSLPVLYGAVARARCFDTTQALLAAGADPNDNESLYHATEQSDRRLLAALAAAGARWTGTNALFRQLDHDDLDGLRQALALGADPNERGPGGRRALHHALQRGRAAAFVRVLLDQGADPQAHCDHGLDAAWYAERAGDREALALLRGAGAGSADRADADDESAFIAACAAGDGDGARAHLQRHPDRIARLSADALRLLPNQAQRGRIDSVRLMLALGWPVATRGDWDASALNQAAFRGDSTMLALLIDHGAHWSEPNGYGGNAMGSCLHAACNEPAPGGDYAGVFAQLLAQGAPPPTDPDALPEALQEVLAQT